MSCGRPDCIEQPAFEDALRHFLIDTDTASDDAIALVMALSRPGVQVDAITVVAGNVPVNQGAQNALHWPYPDVSPMST